jgi:lipopolysaccharide transport system ATP-binding protein
MSSEPGRLITPGRSLEVRNVSKAYRIYQRPVDRFKQAFAWGRRQYFREFWALRDVSFDVAEGEMVGIVGRNGSGKSTLLQIIAGTLTPTNGEVVTRNRVAALLELGSGFEIDASGRENVFMNGAILGLTREEMVRKYDSIVAFADIGEFIDQPVRTYSSGMLVRLAFAVAAHVDADILIIDEALAVGDAAFQAKCFRRIDELRRAGVTILLATHDMHTLQTMCQRALLLDRGAAVLWDDAKAVGEEYYRRVYESETRAAAAAAPVVAQADSQDLDPVQSDRGTRVGDGRAELFGVALYDANGRKTCSLPARETFRVELGVRFTAPVHDPHVGVGFRDVYGRILQGVHTLHDGGRLGPVSAGSEFVLRFEAPLLLNPGRYLLMLGVAEHHARDSWKDLDVFFDFAEVEVYGQAQSWGIVNHAGCVSRVSP